MKFKVGDKVRIREDLIIGKKYGSITNYSFLSEIDKNLGVQIITEITEEGNYKLNKAKFIYSKEMLEPVKEKENEMEKMVIIRDGSKVIAKYYKDDKTVSAEAKCSPEDEFDFGIGAKLAMDRAIEKMKEGEIGYSWVKCVGYRQKDEFYFTVDKVYKIYDDGRITSDNGYVYGGKDSFNNSKEKIMVFLGDYYIFEEVQN